MIKNKRKNRPVVIWSLRLQQHAPFNLSFPTRPTLKSTLSGAGPAAHSHHIPAAPPRLKFASRLPPTTGLHPPTGAGHSLSSHSGKVPTEALNGHDLFPQNRKVHEAAVLTPRTRVAAHTNAGLTRHLSNVHGRGTAGNKERGPNNREGCILMSR